MTNVSVVIDYFKISVFKPFKQLNTLLMPYIKSKWEAMLVNQLIYLRSDHIMFCMITFCRKCSWGDFIELVEKILRSVFFQVCFNCDRLKIESSDQSFWLYLKSFPYIWQRGIFCISIFSLTTFHYKISIKFDKLCFIKKFKSSDFN